MIKKALILVALAATIAACNTNSVQKGAETETKEVAGQKEVPYEVAKNYFVKNTVGDGILTLKITTQEEFDKYFGSAATMGENGKPTGIDFSKQYVIAVIGESTNKSVVAEPLSLTKDGNVITLTYKWEEGTQEQTYTARHQIAVIVANEYQGEVKYEKQ